MFLWFIGFRNFTTAGYYIIISFLVGELDDLNSITPFNCSEKTVVQDIGGSNKQENKATKGLFGSHKFGKV